MNATTRPYATSTPLTSPAPAPTARAQATMTIQPYRSAICCVASVVAHTDARPRTEPTDRSMPPAVMTKVMPMLTTPTTEAALRITTMLSRLANRLPAVT